MYNQASFQKKTSINNRRVVGNPIVNPKSTPWGTGTLTAGHNPQRVRGSGHSGTIRNNLVKGGGIVSRGTRTGGFVRAGAQPGVRRKY